MLESVTQPLGPPRNLRPATTKREIPTRRSGDSSREGADSLAVTVSGDFIRVTGKIPMVTAGGNPVAYRVLIAQEHDAMSADLPERIVGAGAPDDIALFVPTRVGRLERQDPWRRVDIMVTARDSDEFGWIDLCKAARRQLSNDTVKNDSERLRWICDGTLMTIDATKLNPEVEWLVVRIEIREILDRATGETRPLYGHGRTGLVRIHSSRSPAE